MTYSPEQPPVYWTVTREPAGTRRPIWLIRDHEGYERFGGYTWRELVDRFCAVAEGYGLTHHLS